MLPEACEFSQLRWICVVHKVGAYFNSMNVADVPESPLPRV